MTIRRTIMALWGTALCAALIGCGGEESADRETKLSSPAESSAEIQEWEEDSPAATARLSGAYQQMLMYIQEGFRKYHVAGEYAAYFGPINGGVSGSWVDGCYTGVQEENVGDTFVCDILLDGGNSRWKEQIAFTYDAQKDWYVFDGQYEPILTGDSDYAEWEESSYAEDILSAYVCQSTVAYDADISAPIRYDSENGPLERELYLDPPWHFRGEKNGLAYQILPRGYAYWDDRLDVYIDIQYPQIELEDGREEMEEGINEKLRGAFFYGYDWEEKTMLDPGREMHTSIERSYMITREDERYLSMRIYEFNAGWGAHPNEWETGITLDMQTGQIVQLKDVLGESAAQEERTLGDLLDSGAFRCLWIWMPGGEDWIEELQEERGDDPLSRYESLFYLTDTGLGLITSLDRYYTCLEADYQSLGMEDFLELSVK